MANDNQELANRLFAAATGVLEDAIEIALEGQSPRLSPREFANCARRLRAAAQDVATVAEAAAIVANQGVNHPRNRRELRR